LIHGQICGEILLHEETWQGVPSLLSATATRLSIIGRMQGDERRLPLSLLASTPFCAGHDVLVASLAGLIADLLSMATGAAMLLRCPAKGSAAAASRAERPGGKDRGACGGDAALRGHLGRGFGE
jgi:hypothetical protein